MTFAPDTTSATELQELGVTLFFVGSDHGFMMRSAGDAAASLHAPDYGVTFLDTATMYGSGHNETLVGKAIAGRRHDFVVASKCGLSSDGIDGRPETLLAQAEASLEKLGVDEIDLYYLHRADPAVPIEESVGALARLVETGKVREIGLSEVSTGTLRRAASEAHIAALQSEYSLWSRTPEAGILGACRELGVAFVGAGVVVGAARQRVDPDSGYAQPRASARKRTRC